MLRPVWPIRLTRTRTQLPSDCLFNRGAGGRQDFSGRQFQRSEQHRRTDAHLFARLTNDTAALQNLAVTQSTVTWTRGGSSPQFARVTFESSTDNVNYTPLGNGTAAGSNWTLTGLSLPTGQNIYIRARGYYRSGYFNGSESITESVRNAFIARHCNSQQAFPRKMHGGAGDLRYQLAANR